MLDIEPGKRLETLKIQYRMINDIFESKSINNLDKLNSEILTEVPYEIYIEDTEHNNIPQDIEVIIQFLSMTDITSLLRKFVFLIF